MTFLEDAAGLADELRSLRRALHADPELGLELPRTQRRVLDALDGLGLEVTLGVSSTAVTAVLRGERPGPVVLLRGDMDALPVAEETGLDFASTNGAMHACGHDLHVTGLVGAAKLLAARRDELPGSVIFMFQPGEEADGGAVRMIEEGVLDAAGERPVAAYGVHVATGRFGVVETRAGTLMAGANELYVTVNGRGGHGSQPVTSVDPVPALLEIGLALQTMVTRRFSVFDPVVVTVTQLSAGQAVNVIPPAARLGATVRTLSQASVETLIAETRRLADGIAAAHGCTAEVDFQIDYPVTVNDPTEAAFALEVAADLFGEDDATELPAPHMGSEDFSYVLAEVPGAFVFLGATPPEIDERTAPWNHSPLVVFDDAVLPRQAAYLAELAWRRLHRS
ncbi:MAG TPA: M20 family metallopeptidase [Propioniciclava sp.]|jgi:amidohydrolase|uniref:M20 metallopeptidase family protein n=1 Tax=Propioniciclava sp. TaxID=2038686 RepID=UPI002C1A9150|nr:M20 family metallopeptidase [Propioniciclava sp.]HRL48453.1 M20 family metallopeptidase [Propioniciclava sp.]HRL80228.1 M20 family metallopeptidase [Propioniciclava sp.]